MSQVEKNDKELVFVIGFPKSGNTWLARLIAEVTNSNIMATNPVDDTDNSINREGKYRIYKLHEADTISISKSSRVVYIVRDVRDVLVSAFYFNNRFINEDCVKIGSYKCGWLSRALSKLYFRHQIRRMNKKWCGNELTVLRNLWRRKKSLVGSWSDHVFTWTKRSNVIVKYEDLLQDTENELRKILILLHIDVNDDVLKKAISNQSFEKKKLKFMKTDNTKNVQFLRSGKAGGWREELVPGLVKKIEMRHSLMMNEYGYKLEEYKGKK